MDDTSGTELEIGGAVLELHCRVAAEHHEHLSISTSHEVLGSISHTPTVTPAKSPSTRSPTIGTLSPITCSSGRRW